ncbi:hypothetical protein C9J22_13145 [Photobacterium phosphoreum]|uniref:hypothetical protein n=1 Tax=Photobacterium phosphoreum TaxID=659 RepID=UPI000D176D75|nr:hypothetical protein [Photobacterium phosphoreum]PSU69818.1 hypothetical protein C9J22_13145 [Photobacterium phosphoreum]
MIIGWVIFSVTLIVFSLCLSIVKYKKSYRSMLYSGVILAVYGLVLNTLSAMFANEIFPESNQESLVHQKDLLSNSFLIISAIGAGFFSTAICSEIKSENNATTIVNK